MLTDQELKFDNDIFIFETAIRVRNTEINESQYLSIDSLSELLSEARMQFLYFRGIKKINADFQGLMIDNLQLVIFSQVRAREELLFEVGIEQLSSDGGDIAIVASRMYDGSLVAKARQHFVNYDYRSHINVKLSKDLIAALS